MFEKLENRYFIRGELVLENEMHIGSGKGDARTDSLLVKDFNNKPFIPGSSLRGNLRSVIEKIAASININSCFLSNPTCVTNSHEIKDNFKQILKKNSQIEINNFLNDDSNICSVCRLFGSTIVASKIKITDLSLKNEKAEPKIRHGVAINRDTETSKDRAKFDFEVVPKDSSFNFELIGENLTEKDCGLLAIGIHEMVNGNFWIGGNSARGLGKCKLENLNIQYFKGVDGLKQYLKSKKLTKMEDIDDFFNCIDTLLLGN